MATKISFSSIGELNQFLEGREELDESDFFEIARANEHLLDAESIEETKDNFDKTNLSDFGYDFSDLMNLMEAE